MASACVNNIGMSTESFLDYTPAKFSSYGWLSPRISLSREFFDDAGLKGSAGKISSKSQAMSVNAEAGELGEPDPEISSLDFGDFEFRLEDPVTMLSADELFADGKLVPLHLSRIRHSMTLDPASSDVISLDTPKFHRRKEISSTDPFLFSPKAPRCSSRWKEFLGLGKLYHHSNGKHDDHNTASPLSSHSQNQNSSGGLNHFLHRSPKSSLSASNNSSSRLPLLKDTDNESMSISARLSLSSSSSGHEHDDVPRLSLDSDKTSAVSRNSHQTSSNLSRVRVAKLRTTLSSENPTARTRVGRSPIKKSTESTVPVGGVSVGSPRMNSSGKVVFNSLERSSSSPSTFNGGPRHRHRGMERSYSANVRIRPVLNVPVYSLRGPSKSGVFGLFSSQQQKKDNGGVGGNRNPHSHCRNRIE